MKKKKRLVKKPNIFVYGLFKMLSDIISKLFFNTKFIRNEIKNKKGPYVVIANHESMIDFLPLCSANINRMQFVISNSFYQSLKINKLIEACGVIPKQQFQTSMVDLRKMKYVLEHNKMPLVLYPAGLMSENGISTPIPKGTGKALKWFDCDVYIAKISGSYLTKPKWSKKYRKGRIDLDIYKLYSKEDVQNKDDKDLQNEIEEILKYNAYKNQEKKLVIHKNGTDIRGLEYVLYQCPKCKREFTIREQNHQLICSSCLNQAQVDKYGFLHKVKDSDIVYTHPSEWSRFILNELYEEIKNDDNFSITGHAQISMINYKKHKFENVGEGQITLTKGSLIINGKINNEVVSKTIFTKEIFLLPFTPGKFFEIQEHEKIYRIYLDQSYEVTKWMNALKMIFYINHNQNNEEE